MNEEEKKIDGRSPIYLINLDISTPEHRCGTLTYTAIPNAYRTL